VGREVLVLGLLADGKSNHRVAEALAMAPSEVRDHAGAIISKLRLERRLQPGMSPKTTVSREDRPGPGSGESHAGEARVKAARFPAQKAP
jgi:Bacterial regulatory proteins, luxR family